MYRNERPGVFRHRHSSHSEKHSGFPPAYPSSFPVRRPPLFPRRRVLINGFPNQGLSRSFVRQPASITDYRPIGTPLMSSRYPAFGSCNNLVLKSMEQPKMPFAHSNNLEKVDVNSISHTFPILQKEDKDHPPGVAGQDIQTTHDLWIETTAPNSRVYYYNASSRVTRWDKPDNVKIMNIDRIRVLANGPHISPMQNSNVEQIYAPASQQSRFGFFPPPPSATGMPPRLFIFPPPNLNSPPPFLTPPPNVPSISVFPRCSSDRFPHISGDSGCSSWSEKDTVYSKESYMPFISHEGASMNKPYFEDTLQDRPNIDEVNDNAGQTEVVSVKIQDKIDSAGVELIHQDQEQLEPLNTADEYRIESNIGSFPVSDSPFNPKHETQNFTSCGNDDQNNASDNITKPVDKSRPVSSTPIPGSKWCVVWTGDDRVFFYDADRKSSVWEMPHELKNRADVKKLVASPPTLPSDIKNKQDEIVTFSKKLKIEEEDVTELKNEVQNMESASTETLIDEAMKKREQLPHETRVQMFLEMLSERNVSAFSTLERELHKVVYDSRYLLLPPKERKQKFEFYLRQKSEEEKKNRKKQSLKIKDEYKILLQEAGVTEGTRFMDFMHQHSKDSRFKAVDKLKDKEVLFNEYVRNLRKNSRYLNEKQNREFLELLKEQHFIDTSINWLDVKALLCRDPRYASINNDYEREKLFNEYVKKYLPHELHSAKEKEHRINTSIETRKQEVHREMSHHLKELNKERENHKFEAVVNSFKALLADLVKTPDISWREARRLLKADHRWTDISDLRDDIRMHYFDEHISYLSRKKREQFRQILAEIPEITLTSSWKEVKNRVLGDTRCKLFSSDSRKCEREFKAYLLEKLREAKNEFKELLKETKIITHASKNLMKISNHLENIENALEQDKRYLVLKCIEKERKEILLSYIDKLHHKGPPPPPTATESVRK